MKYKYIVWDWNGTLLDDLDVCLKSINTILEKYKLPKLKSIKEYRGKFGFPVINYYKAIGFDFSKYTFKTVGKEFIDIYTELSPKCNLHNDALETLILLRNRNFNQIILSASQQTNLLNQVRQYNIQQYFKNILGIKDIYADSKLDIAKNWISSCKIEPNTILFIGDTTHDAEVAKSLNCDCILFSQGHQDYDRLFETKNKVFKDLNNIYRYITSSI